MPAILASVASVTPPDDIVPVMQRGDVVRHKREDGFFVVLYPVGDQVFIVPLKEHGNGRHVRLPSDKGWYAEIAELKRDLMTESIAVRLGEQ